LCRLGLVLEEFDLVILVFVSVFLEDARADWLVLFVGLLLCSLPGLFVLDGPSLREVGNRYFGG